MSVRSLFENVLNVKPEVSIKSKAMTPNGNGWVKSIADSPYYGQTGKSAYVVGRRGEWADWFPLSEVQVLS